MVQFDLRAGEVWTLPVSGRVAGICNDVGEHSCRDSSITNGCMISSICCRAMSTWALSWIIMAWYQACCSAIWSRLACNWKIANWAMQMFEMIGSDWKWCAELVGPCKNEAGGASIFRVIVCTLFNAWVSMRLLSKGVHLFFWSLQSILSVISCWRAEVNGWMVGCDFPLLVIVGCSGVKQHLCQWWHWFVKGWGHLGFSAIMTGCLYKFIVKFVPLLEEDVAVWHWYACPKLQKQSETSIGHLLQLCGYLQSLGPSLTVSLMHGLG